MLLLFLSLISYYDLVKGQIQAGQYFNESQLSGQLRQSIMQVDSFLKDVQHKIKRERTDLKPIDYEEFLSTKEHMFLDHSLTNIRWNETLSTGESIPQSWILPTSIHDVAITLKPPDNSLTTKPGSQVVKTDLYSRHPPQNPPDFPKHPHYPTVHPDPHPPTPPTPSHTISLHTTESIPTRPRPSRKRPSRPVATTAPLPSSPPTSTPTTTPATPDTIPTTISTTHDIPEPDYHHTEDQVTDISPGEPTTYYVPTFPTEHHSLPEHPTVPDQETVHPSPDWDYHTTIEEPTLSDVTPSVDYHTTVEEPTSSDLTPDLDYHTTIEEPTSSDLTPNLDYHTTIEGPTSSDLTPSVDYQTPIEEPTSSDLTPDLDYHTTIEEPTLSDLNPSSDYHTTIEEPTLSDLTPGVDYHSAIEGPTSSDLTPDLDYHTTIEEPTLLDVTPNLDYQTPIEEPTSSDVTPDLEYQTTIEEPTLSDLTSNLDYQTTIEGPILSDLTPILEPDQTTIEQHPVSPTLASDPPEQENGPPLFPTPFTRFPNISHEHFVELMKEHANFSVIEEYYRWLFQKRPTKGPSLSDPYTSPSDQNSTRTLLEHGRQGIVFPYDIPPEQMVPGPVYQGDPMIPGQQKLIKEGPDGFPVVVHETTVPMPEGVITTLLDDGRIGHVPENIFMHWTTTTIAGDVLEGRFSITTAKSVREKFREELREVMNKEMIGYMSIFLLRLTYIVATKKEEHVKQVIIHMEPIVIKLFEARRLAYLGQPLIRVTETISRAVSEAPFDVIKTYAVMVHYMLKDRKQTAAVDINTIIDYADSLYEDEEGDKMFDVIKEFEDYPNISKSSYDLCNDLIEHFMSPFRRLTTSERRQKLLDSVNHALRVRFPKLQNVINTRKFYETLLKFNRGKKYTMPRTLHNMFTRSTTEYYLKKNRRQNRHHKSNPTKDVPYIRPHRRTKVIKKRNRHNNQQSEYNYEKHLRRNYYNPPYYPNNHETNHPNNPYIELPISTGLFQKRFSVISSGPLTELVSSKIQRKPTTELILYSRPTTDYKLSVRKRHGNYGPTPYANTNQQNFFLGNLSWASYRIDRRKIKKFKYPIHERYTRATLGGGQSFGFRMRDVRRPERRKNSEIVKVKKNILRSIVEGSSYSDEEEALKDNLVRAMIHGNKSQQLTNRADSEVIERFKPTRKPATAQTTPRRHEFSWKEIVGAMRNRI